jgi:hypothetical protein
VVDFGASLDEGEDGLQLLVRRHRTRRVGQRAAARVDFNAIAGPARDAAHDTSMREAIELIECGRDQGPLRDIAGMLAIV